MDSEIHLDENENTFNRIIDITDKFRNIWFLTNAWEDKFIPIKGTLNATQYPRHYHGIYDIHLDIKYNDITHDNSESPMAPISQMVSAFK